MDKFDPYSINLFVLSNDKVSQAKNDLEYFEQREHTKAKKNPNRAAYVGHQVNKCYLRHLSNFCVTRGWIKNAYRRCFLFKSFIS